MKRLSDLKLLGLVAFLTVALVFIGLSFVQGQEATISKGKPVKPEKKPGKPGGNDSQDMPLCIDFEGQLTASVDPLCDSGKGVDVYAGRNWGITIKIHKKTRDPYLIVSPAPLPLNPMDGDPGLTTGFLPVLGSNGRISEPEFTVSVGVNVKDMAIGADHWTNGRLRFKDDYGTFFTIFWGPYVLPDGRWRTNPSAPAIHIHRNDDADGKRNWSVMTQEDEGARSGYHTAFLWGLTPGSDLMQYCGAYQVSFSYFAIEE